MSDKILLMNMLHDLQSMKDNLSFLAQDIRRSNQKICLLKQKIGDIKKDFSQAINNKITTTGILIKMHETAENVKHMSKSRKL